MKEKYLKIFILGCLFVFLFLSFFRPIEMEDIWWHLNTGKWILKHKQVPREALFSFLDIRTPAISIQWLGSLIYYLVYLGGQDWGLKFFRAFLFLFIISIFFLRYYRKIPFFVLIFLVLFMAYGIGTRCLLRPFVFNLVFVQLFLIILWDALSLRRPQRLILIPLLGIPWGNIHLGSFIYGMLLIGVFLLSVVIQYLESRIRRYPPEVSIDLLRKLKQLLGVLGVYMLIFFINPYGWEGALYPYNVFFNPGFINFDYLANVIDELRPPIVIFETFLGLWFFVLLLFSLVAVGLNRNNQFLNILLLIFSVFLFLRGARGIELFTIVSVYLIAEGVSQISPGSLPKIFIFTKELRPILYFFLVLFLIGGIINCINQKIYRNNTFVRAISLEYVPKNPIRALAFLNENKITGAVFNQSMLGGLISWRYYPSLKPFVDGRLDGHPLNQELFLIYKTILREPESFWSQAEEKFHLRIALFDTSLLSSHRLIEYLNHHADWQLIFMDGPIVIFVKRGIFDLPREVNQFQTSFQSIPLTEGDLQDLRSMDLKESGFEIRKFLDPPPAYIQSLEEGVTLLGLGYQGAGVKKILAALPFCDQRIKREVVKTVIDTLAGVY